MKPLLFHPSRRALEEWLQADTEDDRLDSHISVCQRCANTLEQMAAPDGDDQSETLAGALAAALAPPVDLPARLEHRVTERLDSRVIFSVLSDLFAAGFETSRLLILDEIDDAE